MAVDCVAGTGRPKHQTDQASDVLIERNDV
jgi:hypothetical protein